MSLSQGVWQRQRNNFLLFAGCIILVFGVSACRSSAKETPATASAAATSPTAEQKVSNRLDGDPKRGATLYGACSGCHGAAGEGISGVGVGLTHNDFIVTHSERELVEFIIEGRTVGAPDNRSGLTMPPSGGNPSLSEQNLYDIVAFLRTLKGNSK